MTVWSPNSCVCCRDNLLHICSCWQGGPHPGRKAFWGVSALCSWMVSLWTWKKGPRSRRGSDPDARATAAATARSVRTRVRAWRERAASPATAAHQPSPGLSVTKVPQLKFTYTDPNITTHVPLCSLFKKANKHFQMEIKGYIDVIFLVLLVLPGFSKEKKSLFSSVKLNTYNAR